jgi:hypothetical protein
MLIVEGEMNANANFETRQSNRLFFCEISLQNTKIVGKATGIFNFGDHFYWKHSPKWSRVMGLFDVSCTLPAQDTYR